MAEKIKLTVQKRAITGKKVKNLRKQGIIPANVYGHKVDSVAVQLKIEEFSTTYKAAGETRIIDLIIDGEKTARPVLFSNVQVSPMDRHILHIDFRQVNLTEKIEAEVPLEFIGESQAEADGGVLVKLKDSVAIKALPGDIPEKFIVELVTLVKIGDMISVADLKAPAKVEIIDTPDMLIAKVDQKQAEEPEATPSETAAEPEVAATPKDAEAPAKE